MERLVDDNTYQIKTTRKQASYRSLESTQEIQRPNSTCSDNGAGAEITYTIWKGRVEGCVKGRLDSRNGVAVEALCIYLASLRKWSLMHSYMGYDGYLISANKSSKGCWNGMQYHQLVLEWLKLGEFPCKPNLYQLTNLLRHGW